MRTIRRDDWTAADYDSQQILHELGHRDAAARVDRARRPDPEPQSATGEDAQRYADAA
ncbi:hypothetical protein ACFQ9J_26745 [Streptomyces sp. NPDC056529]|uniref:hypothetical protein n=1 Tax=Streptomyces sp. NPDC056529 TaxID=3345855 RepID=UPI00367DA24E